MHRHFLALLITGLLISLAVPSFAGKNSTISASEEKVTTGGRFILQTHLGKIVTDKDFSGKFMLVYFGYTYCPDVCPTSLLVMTQALELLKKDAEKVQPIFITVDPQRDTMAVMNDYVSAFHPGIIGLTGTRATIDSVVKKYRVVAKKVSEKGADEDDYSMDHTASVFLMGPDGKYLLRFPYNTTGEQMAAKLSELIAKLKTN